MSYLATLEPSADTWMDADNKSTNYGTAINFYIGELSTGAAYRSRALIKFDFAPYANAEITAATIDLYKYHDLASNDGTIYAYRVLQNWEETQATWNVYSTGNNWATAGCLGTPDRETSPIGTSGIVGLSGAGLISFALTPSKIQEWANGSAQNYGMLLKTDLEDNDGWGYYSSEYTTDVSKRPHLIIEYTLASDSGYNLMIFT